MPISALQKHAIESIINTLSTATGPRKRQLSSMFMVLVDRNDWPEYFEIIPEPRSINQVRESLEKNRYKSALDAFIDLSLVFWNAIFYNEPNSQIVKDAEELKGILEKEWRIRQEILPQPRSLSPPPSSAQKVHKSLETNSSSSTSKATAQATATIPAAPTAASSSQLAPTPARVVQPTPPTPVPPAASSNSNSTTAKPPTVPAKRQLTPEPETDIMSPEPEGQGYGQNYDGAAGSEEMERDAESEEIVKQLEKSLPRWPGFGEEGWMEHGNETLYAAIVHTVKSYKSIIGSRLAAAALESVPDVLEGPTSPSSTPISLKIIEARARAQEYSTPKSFDQDMSLLFLKARRWHEPGSEPYGCVLTLQRLYQALTSVNPPPPPGPPYSSTTYFASIRAGPGNVKPVHGQEEGVAGVTSHRVLTRDRKFVDEVLYKGWSVKLADWLHLSNPDDPSRPIIAQVFRCWVSEEESKRGQVGVTVSWYYRPEQTYHSANRIFWEGEVFKTSHFADHPLPDIIEKIACQFTARHVRGRPRAPYWWPGFPLYVCDSRYNDRDRVFVRIKNWNSCIPEEVRKSEEFMPIYPFERTVFPSRFPSPFVGKGGKGKGLGTGPGGIIEVADQGDVDGHSGGEGSRRRKAGAGDTGQSKGVYVGNVATGSGAGAAGINNTSGGMTSYGTLQLQPPMYNHNVAGSGGGIGTVAQSSTMASAKPSIDRSVLTAAGGGANAQVEKLPPETTRHFDRDPDTNEVLWFSSPPVNVARRPTPRHSLAYLHFLAMKRKREADGGNAEGDHDGESDHSTVNASKKRRNTVPPTVTELLASVQVQREVEGLTQ